MTLVQTEPKSIKIGSTDLKKVCMWVGGVEQQIRPPIPKDALYFEANTANSTIALNVSGSPTSVILETSTDYFNWTTYSFGSTITLSNVGDKVYFRNTSPIPTGFSTADGNRYQFSMSGSIAAKGDIGYLLCKKNTNVLSSWCFVRLFRQCSSLTTPPKLSATTLANNCYYFMFLGCSNLSAVNLLPATTLPSNCYYSMYNSCSKIKLSTTQTGEYQTAYRIPTTGTGTAGTDSLLYMFYGTGGTWTGTPTINTTYYTSNAVI